MCVVWWLWNLEKLFAWPAMPNSFDLDALILSFLPFVEREQLLGHKTTVFLIALHWRSQWMQQSQRNATVNISLAMFAANFSYAVCSRLIFNKQQCSKMFIINCSTHGTPQILFHLLHGKLIPISIKFDCEPLSNNPLSSLDLLRTELHNTNKKLCQAEINTTFCT